MTNRNAWLQPVVVLGLCLSAAALRAQYLECTIPVGHLPVDVLWNPTSNKVYVANSESYDVTIIDGATNAVVRTIPVPTNSYLAGLCWNSVENKVYCTSTDPDWLSVIDGAGDTLRHRVRTRGRPTYMAYNAAMNKLYVVCFDDCMVRVFDGSSDALVAEVWLGEFNTPYTLLWHPISNRVFCATWADADDTLFAIDCAGDTVADGLNTDEYPYAMCRNPRSDLVYVSGDPGVTIVSACGDTVMDTILTYAGDMCFVPYPNKMYAVTNWTVVIDCDRNVVIESLPYRGDVVLCDTIHRKVYGVSENVNRVYVYDAQADSLLMTIQLPLGAPRSAAWNWTNSRVYVADDGADVVYVIHDTSTAVSEPAPGAVRKSPPFPFICRGRLRLEGESPAALLAMTGRKVMRLEPGENSLRGLRAGVYFVMKRDDSHATKVILQD